MARLLIVHQQHLDNREQARRAMSPGSRRGRSPGGCRRFGGHRLHHEVHEVLIYAGALPWASFPTLEPLPIPPPEPPADLSDVIGADELAKLQMTATREGKAAVEKARATPEKRSRHLHP